MRIDMELKSWLKILILVCLFLLIWGCGAKPPEEILTPPPIPEQERLPVDYLFMIDNSRSIPPGASREFAREAIKAFAELTEFGDKIAIIAFDERASVIVNRVIRNQEDREAIKQAAERGLTFGGQYTDISQPFLYLSAHRGELIRGKGYLPAGILLSDGKLEPRPPRRTEEAYNDIINSLPSEIPFYTIGLGDTEINDKFLEQNTGLILLRDKIANATGGRFYQILSVNELIDTYFRMLRATKGISEVPGRYIFTVDESTNKITTVVLKKTATEDICTTQDIFIQDAGMQKIVYNNYSGFYQAKNLPTNITWQSGNYYDLIIIDNPFPGKWQIGLNDGREPKIVSLLKSLVNLRYKVEKNYWVNEEKIVTCWLYDERNKSLSPLPCKVTAKFDKEEDFDKSHNEIEFQMAETNIYLAKLKADTIGNYLLQISAENEENFFQRVSEPTPFRIRQSYFDFSFPPEVIRKSTTLNWITGWKGILFKTVIDTGAESYTTFQKDPEVTLYLEEIDKEGKRHPRPQMLLEKDWKEGKIIYEKLLNELCLGGYAGHYQIKGTLNTGREVDVSSESFSFDIKRPWWEYVVMVLIGLAIMGLIVWLVFWKMDWRFGRQRLVGSLNIVSPANYSPKNVPLKKNKKARAKKWGRGSEYLEFGKGKEIMGDLQNTAFRLEAYYGRPTQSDYNQRERTTPKKRKTKKLVRLATKEGTVKVKVVVLGKEREILASSQNIYNGDKITFTDGGRNFEITFNASKIKI